MQQGADIVSVGVDSIDKGLAINTLPPSHRHAHQHGRFSQSPQSAKGTCHSGGGSRLDSLSSYCLGERSDHRLVHTWGILVDIVDVDIHGIVRPLEKAAVTYSPTNNLEGNLGVGPAIPALAIVNHLLDPFLEWRARVA